MSRNTKTHLVTLPNGEERKVVEWPDPESRHNMLFSPKRMDDEGYGVTCESLQSAITWMFQWDCEHNVIENDAVSNNPKITPLPYKCTKCMILVSWKILLIDLLLLHLLIL